MQKEKVYDKSDSLILHLKNGRISIHYIFFRIHSKVPQSMFFMLNIIIKVHLKNKIKPNTDLTKE